MLHEHDGGVDRSRARASAGALSSRREDRTGEPTEAAPPAPSGRVRKKARTRDGLYQRKDLPGWWWISYDDADGRRRRQQIKGDYRTARRYAARS
jgi:hypothetical protein